MLSELRRFVPDKLLSLDGQREKIMLQIDAKRNEFEKINGPHTLTDEIERGIEKFQFRTGNTFKSEHILKEIAELWKRYDSLN